MLQTPCWGFDSFRIWMLNQEKINKYLKTTKSRHTQLIRPESIKETWKKQFNAKQSFKTLYSDIWFFTDNRSLEQIIKKNTRCEFKKKFKLRDGYYKNIIKNKSVAIKDTQNIFEIQNTVNVTSLNKIETRLDILLCRLGWALSLTDAHFLIRNNLVEIFDTDTNSFVNIPYRNVRLFVPKGTAIRINRSSHDLESRLKNRLSTIPYMHTFSASEYNYSVLLRYPTEQEILLFWLNSGLEVNKYQARNSDTLKKISFLNTKIQHLLSFHDKLKLV